MWEVLVNALSPRVLTGIEIKISIRGKDIQGVWDALTFMQVLIFHFQSAETPTWKFNVGVRMCCVEPPNPCRLLITGSFPCLSLALLCAPVTAKVLEQDLLSPTSPDGPALCILIWRSEEADACRASVLCLRHPQKISGDMWITVWFWWNLSRLCGNIYVFTDWTHGDARTKR